MQTLAVLIPVLARPHRVTPLLHSLERSTISERSEGWRVAPLFICSEGDHDEIEAVKASGSDYLTIPGERNQYARKINAGALYTNATFLLTAADDLDFQPGWLREAISVHVATGALVIGTNDGANPSVIAGRHATHSLVHRDYVARGTIDKPGILLHPGYDHNAVDVEFTETAQARGVWAFAAKSLVLHMHPVFDRQIRRDATYNKGIANALIDKHLCDTRRRLWNPDAPTPRELRFAHARRRRPAPVSRWPAR